MRFASALATDPGHVRAVNEDSCAIDQDHGCYVLSDGMGGGPDGQVASQIVCAVMIKKLCLDDAIDEAVKAAHLALRLDSRRRSGTRNSGATLAALRLNGERYDIVWIGDTRIYRWNGRLTLLTCDHSVVQGLLSSGAISADEVADHPYRHNLTQVLGKTDPEELKPEYMSGKVYPGERYLLCSDGLYGELSGEQFNDILGQNLDARETAQKLVDTVLQGPAADNLSVIVVDILED